MTYKESFPAEVVISMESFPMQYLQTVLLTIRENFPNAGRENHVKQA
jgi:hypothetical protein